MQTINNIKKQQRDFQLKGSGDLAFAVVVLASYFAMFSSLKEANLWQLLIMVVLGICYITIGIYGYNFVSKKKSFYWSKFYFLIQIPIGAIIVFLGKGAGFSAILLLPLAGQAVVLAPGYWLYLINFMIIAGYVLSVRQYSGDLENVWASLPTILAGLIYVMVFTQMAIDEERSKNEVERLVLELEDVNDKLRSYANEVEQLTVIKERNRIAREIHDGLGHYLTTIHMQLLAAQAIIDEDPTKAKDSIENARSQSQMALLDVRRSVSTLRYDQTENETIREALDRAIRPCEWIGIKSHLEINGNEKDLDHSIRSTIFRIVQETVNNTCKYSKAENYECILDFSDEKIIFLHISDDGLGMNEFRSGYGLQGLKERIELLHGTLNIYTSPQIGFRIEIELPYA
ncbi:MAG TPA: sensor histidine kinase [Anaerolineaceae bacterium]|nr:sensor histidine kinase [Anaerolineaceae bacterium]